MIFNQQNTTSCAIYQLANLLISVTLYSKATFDGITWMIMHRGWSVAETEHPPPHPCFILDLSHQAALGCWDTS